MLAGIIGDDAFRIIWKAWEVDHKDTADASKKLAVLMKLADMSELKGSMPQTDYLLAHISRELAPCDPFWKDVAGLVQTAFPRGLVDSSVNDTGLARMVHQFRYVIDACQVRYIREHYGGFQGAAGKHASDEEMLAQYLSEQSGSSWNTKESDRLHQKYCRDNNDVILPAGAGKVNIKITCHFHTEFILQNGDRGTGRFAYILDASDNNQNSILNGASFNYADRNDYHSAEDRQYNHEKSRHYNLDIETGTKLDPVFRKAANIYYSAEGDKKFAAPSKAEYAALFQKNSSQNKQLFEQLITHYGKAGSHSIR